MVAVAVSPGVVNISGVAVTGRSDMGVDPSDPIVIYGVPVGVTTAATTPTSSPDAVHARVLTSSGAFICHLPHTEGLHWTDEHNSAGSGSIDAHRYDDLETAHPTLWAAGNQVLVSVGSLDVFRLILDAEPGYRIDETGKRIDTRTGLGQLGVLNSGMVEPEYGWRTEATEERSFNYGSNPNIGGWYVPSEWKQPVGKLVRKSWRWTYKKRHLPKGWPDRKAQWLWWKNPDGTGVPNEFCYFISSFTLSSAKRIKFWVCGDDTLEFQVDGEIRASAGPGGWKRPTKFVMQLSAGTHTVAAKVQNAPGTTGNSNRSGFLCSIAHVASDGDVISYIRRTTPATWKVRRQRSGPPGWFPAQILKRIVDEETALGAAGHSGITFGFTTTRDSAGAGWVSRNDLSLTVGALGLDYVQKLVETGMDVAMTPGLVLNAWRTRGTDLSRVIRLDQGSARPVNESGTQSPTIRNTLYAKATTGWVGVSDAASIGANGRRATVVSLGSSSSPSQSAAALNAMLPDLADPPQTIEVELPGNAGWQPYRHFNVADWVGYKPAGATTWGRYRVMSISGDVNESGTARWTVQLYQD